MVQPTSISLYADEESEDSYDTFLTRSIARQSNDTTVNNDYEQMEEDDIYEAMEVIQEDVNDYLREFEDNERMDSYDSLPSPEDLLHTTSEISSSTTSTIPTNNIDNFWNEFANNIRDNLNENMDTILQSADQGVSSHIQIEIPFINDNLDTSSNYIFRSSYHLP